MFVFMFCVLVAMFFWMVSISSKVGDISFELEQLKNGKAKKAIAKKTISEKISEVVFEEVEETPKTKQKATKKQEPSFNFEKFFMENIFNKLGAVAILIGVGIFIKLISPYVAFGPLGKVVGASFLGLFCMLASVKIHKKEMHNYAEVLMGLGIGVLFVAAYGGAVFYDVIPYALAMAFGTGLVVLSYFVAKHYKTLSTMLIGLIGGYLTPYVFDDYGSTSFLFSYFIFMNVVSLVYVFENKNRFALNYYNLSITAASFLFFEFGRLDDIYFIFPVLLWGAYVIYDFLNINKDYGKHNKMLNGFNYLVLIFFTTILYGFEDKLVTGGLVFGVGVVYFVVGLFYNKIKSGAGDLYFSGSVLSLLLSLYYVENEVVMISCWAVCGLLLALLAKSYQKAFLERWSLTALCAALTAVLCSMETSYGKTLFLNIESVKFLVPTACAFLSALVLSNQCKKISEFLKFLALSFVYLYLVSQISSINGEYKGQANRFYQFYTNLILTFIYSVSAYRLFKNNGFTLFAIGSYAMYAIALLVLMTAREFDLMPIFNIRFAAIGAGIVVSLFLARWSTKTLFNYIAIALGLWLVSTEVVDATRIFDNQAESVLLSLSWIAYAAALMGVGIFKNIKILKISGIWIAIVAGVKFVLYDLQDAEPLFRTIAFLVFGGVFMSVSYYYTKNKAKKIK